MKPFLALLICQFLLTSPAQDPVVPKKDNIYVEFITDCNWVILGLKGKIKLKADRPETSRVGFHAWEPNMHLGTREYRGWVIFRELSYPWVREYLCFGNSAYIATFPDRFLFPSFPGWNYAIRIRTVPNAGAIMRVWGPAELILLYHGEALIRHGDKTEYVKVDQNDYANFPVWKVTLK